MSAHPYVMAAASGAAAGARPARSGFDRIVAAVAGWLVLGMWLDAWAHHNVPSTLETFFTPWHGVLYSGLLGMLGVLIVPLVLRRTNTRRGRLGVLPEGYELALAGALVFGAGGLTDMAWHLLFGVEVDLEALLSPSHLLLAVGGVLMVSGPLRAAWRRPVTDTANGWAALLPALLSLSFVLSLLMFFTEYANPFSIPWPARESDIVAGFAQEVPGATIPEMLGHALGVTSILLQTGFLMGVLLLAMRRWHLPFGAATLVFTLAIGLSVIPHGQYLFVPVALVGGLVADLLRARLRPDGQPPGALRLYAFAVPASLFALYFLVLALAGGVGWTVHLWTGTVALAGIMGLLLSYLVLPPLPTAAGAREVNDARA